MRVLGYLCSLIGLSLLLKSLSLWLTLKLGIDGDGIGIHFLWFEVNDTVYTADIITYVNGFLGMGLSILLVGLGFILLNRIITRQNTEKTDL